VLLGRTRLRFDAPAPASAAEPPPGDARSTVGWQAVKPTDLFPSLVVLTPKEDGPRFPLNKADLTIGRDPDCEISLPDDPLAARRHARLTRDAQGVWHVTADSAARNGLWVRLTDPLPVGKTCVFLLGEQRFLLRPP
jgi:Inner membrane component of T3SS, cytoplasmic domain